MNLDFFLAFFFHFCSRNILFFRYQPHYICKLQRHINSFQSICAYDDLGNLKRPPPIYHSTVTKVEKWEIYLPQSIYLLMLNTTENSYLQYVFKWRKHIFLEEINYDSITV